MAKVVSKSDLDRWFFLNEIVEMNMLSRIKFNRKPYKPQESILG